MTSAATFDAGPLSWVKGEIDLALERVTQGLQQFGANTADLAQLKFCRTHLHQVRGALTIVGLDGLTQFTDALEALITDLESGKQPADAPRIGLIGRAVAAIRRYLEDLLAGDPNQPLRLVDLYRQLAAARGLPVPSPSELFFPDLSIRPQLPQVVIASDGVAQLKSARTRYQKGLLAFIKSPDTPIGPLELKLAAQKAANADASPALRGFWWVASGFFAALGEKAIASDAETKALCTRIDQQLRQQSDGGRAVPEKLMRDVLFQVAIAKSKNPDIQAIKVAYELAALIPSAETKTVSQAAQLEPFLKRLKEIATASEEAWNKFCTGSNSALQTFCDASAALDQGAERLGHVEFRRLIRAIAAMANWIKEDRKRHSESIALEMATGILLVGNGVDNFTRLGPDFVHQVNVMVSRLEACMAGKAMPQDAEVPVLDEMTRRAQEKLLVAQVVKEIQSSLGVIEQALDTFFREPDQRDQLATCQKPVSQIIGALSILGHMDAVAQLQESAKRIALFQTAGYQADKQDFELVARQLSALGFFVEALQSGVSDYHAFIASLEAKPSKVDAAAEADATPAPNVDVKVPVIDQEPLTAPALDLAPTPSTSGEAEPMPEPLLASSDESQAPAAAEPVTAVVEPEIDAELLEIFLEEANEVIGTIGEQIDTLRAHPADTEALTTLRRAFHTLKGSSRMVGLMNFGDVAWVIEQVHNLWLRQEKPVDQALLSLVELSQSVFAAWIGHLEGNGEPLPDTTDLLAQGEQLKGGETITAPGRPLPGEATPAETDLSLAEEATEDAAAPDDEPAAISFDIELPVLEIADEFSETSFSFDVPAEAPTPSDSPSSSEPALSLDQPVETSAVEGDMPAIELTSMITLDEGITEAPLDASDTDTPALEIGLADEEATEVDSIDLASLVIAPESLEDAVDTKNEEVLESPEELVIEAVLHEEAPADQADLAIDLAQEPGAESTVQAASDEDDMPAIELTSMVMPDEGVTEAHADAPDSETPITAIELETEASGEPDRLDLDSIMALPEVSAEEVTEPEIAVLDEISAEFPEAESPAPENNLALSADLLDATPIALEPAPSTENEATETAASSDPTLYQIFLEEAHIHIATLQRCFGELEISPGAPTQNEMLRAAHTLGSISGTVGFKPALKLGHGVEAVLLRRDKSGNPDSLEALETLRIAIAELESMLAAIERNEPLGDPSALVAQMEELYPCIAAETIEAAASNIAHLAKDVDEPAAIDEPLPDDQIDESLLPIFQEEAVDLVASINERLAMWSANPYDTDTIHALTRLLHTLKGSARMAGAMRLGALTHRLESSIESALRAGGADPVLVAALQADFDDIAEMSEHLGEANLANASTPTWLTPVAEVTSPETVAPQIEEFASDMASLVIEPEPVPEVAQDIQTEDAGEIILEDTPVAPEIAIELDDSLDVVPVDFQDTSDPVPELAQEITLDAPIELSAATENDEIALPDLESEMASSPAEEALDLTESLAAEVQDSPTTKDEVEMALIEVGETDQSGDPVALTELPSDVTVDALDFDLDAPAEDLQNFAANATLDLTADFGAVELTPPASDEPESVAEALPEDHLDPDLLPIFLEEAVEIVRTVYEQLDAWQAAPSDSDATHGLARSLHTLKGSARMAGAMSLGALTHTLESRAEEAAKSGRASAALIEEMKHAFDAIAQIVERLQRGESLADITIELPSASAPAVAPVATVPTPKIVEPVASVEAAKPAEVKASTAPVPAARPISAPVSSAITAPAAPAAVAAAVAAQRKDTDASKAMLRIPAGLIDNLVNDAGELSIARARIEGEMRSLKQSLLDLTENVIRLRRQLREIEIQAESQLQSRTATSTDGQGDFDPLELDRFTRFQEVTRMMAESVNDVATVQLNLLKNLDEANAGLAAQARLNRELQQALMSVRMVPFSSITERLYRIVRQTAKELGKKADLDVQGSGIELDQNVINKMIGPLEHLLRNAISHGVEMPALRVEQGKDEMGQINLSLRQEGNEVIVTMRDDGAGLNFSRIREKAIANGLMSASDPYDERKLTEMIFHSGFSTAAQVSQIAGRGVGMDVVMTEVTNLGGRIDVSSESGKGSIFRIYLPLTLAVTNAVLVRVGSRFYAIPAAMIDQVQEIKEGPLTELRNAGGADWLGNHYPFHFLPHLLGEPKALPEARRMYWVLYLHSGLQRVAVQVDELQSTHEIVVKNIGPQLSRVVGIAGATVMGDGRVILILNPVALAARAPVTQAAVEPTLDAEGQVIEGATADLAVAPEVPEKAIHLPTILVVDDSLTVRKITSRLLAREGYQVMTAKDGQDALEQMVEVIPDVILSDIEMPRMDGFELARNIRADARLVNIPIVMISSRTADKHRSHAAELGVNHFLGKPYQEDELLGLITEFLAAQKAE